MLDEECYSCGMPSHPYYSDDIESLCEECGEEQDRINNLTDTEVEELFRDSPISLAEWEYIIVHGLED